MADAGLSNEREGGDRYVSPSAYIGPPRRHLASGTSDVQAGSGTHQEASTSTGSTSGSGDMVVLTPSRLRLDSRVLALHCTSQWLSNGIFAMLLYFKVGDY